MTQQQPPHLHHTRHTATHNYQEKYMASHGLLLHGISRQPACQASDGMVN